MTKCDLRQEDNMFLDDNMFLTLSIVGLTARLANRQIALRLYQQHLSK